MRLTALSIGVGVQLPSFAQLPEFFALEAEDAALESPMVVASDTTASGGQYIYTSQGNAGSASFTFTSEQGGDFVVWALCAATLPNPGGHNSFFVSVDGSGEDVWDLFSELSDNPHSSWSYDGISARCGGSYTNNLCDPRVLNLTPGTHTLTIRGRETFSRLDLLIITSDLDFNPLDPGIPDDISLTIAWDPPTEYEDGSPLTALKGYHVLHWTDDPQDATKGPLVQSTVYTIDNLEFGKAYHVAVTAVDTLDSESLPSDPPLKWAYGDLDTDGMQDSWEQAYFSGSTGVGTSGDGDYDQDGIDNYEEYVLGTDPTVPSDGLKISVTCTNNQPCVSFPTTPAIAPTIVGYDRVYMLESKPSGSSIWEPVPSFENVVGYGQLVERAVPGGSAPFDLYRVRTWLQIAE